MRHPAVISFALVVASALFVQPANAQGSAANGQRKAYDFARRCVVVDGKTDRAGAKIAYDAAFKLGRLLGLTDDQIDDDFNTTISREAVSLARSPAYRRQLTSECRQLGMAS